MDITFIKLRNCYQSCFVELGEVNIEPRTSYIVETEHGVDIGNTCKRIKLFKDAEVEKKGKVIRKATEEDMKVIADIESIEKRAFDICKKKVVERKLQMKLVSVKSLFDKTKIIFYFVAENRVDFRELVKDLAAVFRTRIEMRQIGVRDETMLLGGFGLCGRELCCGYLNNGFDPVSIKMAKEQNLNLNSLKISGMCGRLLCCLGYEYKVYKEINEHLPTVETEIRIGTKIFTVVSVDTLKGLIKIRNENNFITVTKEDIKTDNDNFFISEEIIKKQLNLKADSHIEYDPNADYK